MRESIEDISNRAFELAQQYEKRYTGCGQTTIAGIFDSINIDSEDVFKAGSGLADGLGLTGDGSCGSLTGGIMVISYLYGRQRKDFADMRKPMKSYILSKKLHDQFVKIYGSCRCYDIQQKLMGRTFNLYDPDELKQAIEFGMFEHCSKVVGETARLTTKIVLEEMENDSQ